MLRAQQFLPSQLRAAWQITLRELNTDEDLSNDGVLSRWFGDARPEFMPGAVARTPLVNNITAAAVYQDQHGRLYAYADPSDYEPDAEPDSVPLIRFTDCLFVAIPNQLRHRANEYDDSVELDARRLPDITEELHLRLLDRRESQLTMTVEVVEMYEPSSENARVSSGFIRINGLVEVIHPGRAQPQACLEALLRGARK